MAAQPIARALNRPELAHEREATASGLKGRTKRILEKFPRINQEAWLVLSLIMLSLLLNLLVASNQMVLGFYTLPTIFSA